MAEALHFTKRLIQKQASIMDALAVLNQIAIEPIAFVVDQNRKLLGSLTDGDIRRGLLKGLSLNDSVESIIQENPVFIFKNKYRVEDIVAYKKKNFMVLPVVDKDMQIVNVISLRRLRSYLPLDVVIMAGGRGERLRPLTDSLPKPMLEISGKPIIEHNINRLSEYGVDDFWISINYLGDIIKDYLGNGENKNIQIEYVNEDKPMGTIGSVQKIKNFKHDHVLIMNSDILTNIDYEHFYLDFIKESADLSAEKPTYTYYSNGGIYLVKRELLEKYIPESTFFNATDLIQTMVEKGHKVISYHMAGYWLDIGKHEDFKKAQDDFKSIRF